MMILPRQARDKHRESTQISAVFLQSIYCTSKHGMLGFMDTLCDELNPTSIVCSTICPGAENAFWSHLVLQSTVRLETINSSRQAQDKQ